MFLPLSEAAGPDAKTDQPRAIRRVSRHTPAQNAKFNLYQCLPEAFRLEGLGKLLASANEGRNLSLAGEYGSGKLRPARCQVGANCR